MISLENIPGEGAQELTIDELSSLKKFFIAQKSVQVDHYDDFLIKTFPLLIRSLKSATGVGNYRITCTDTIAIWLLRASQLCSKCPKFEKTIGDMIFANDDSTFLFRYVVDYCNETGAPSSNSLRDVFTKLLTLLKRYNPQELFKSWADETLGISHGRRVQYYLVELLCKEIEQNDYLIIKDPSFASDTIQLMSSNALANPIGKAVSAIYKKLYTDEDHAEEWVSLYWSPIKQGIKNPALRRGIEQYILPNLFKFSKTAFKVFVNDLQDDIDLFITCLNIGQTLAIEEDPFPNLVSLEVVNKLLVNDAYKIKIFQMLTYSPKGSRPISSEVFGIMRNSLDVYFTDCEVETRNEFHSLFKQFIFRIKDSAYALHRDATKLEKKSMLKEAQLKFEQVNIIKSFLKWLLSFIKEQIKPGAQYQRVSTGFKILQFLADTGLDSKISVKLDIYYPFNIEMFDESFIRLFFDNILSTYEDIRMNAVSLLVLSKITLNEQHKYGLIEKGLRMLGDYTKSEAGAMILECLYLLQNDDLILKNLISNIPLNTDIKKAVYSPVDGYFEAMSLILKRMNKFSDCEQVIQIVEKNWETVREILSHDSPEGCDQYGVGSAQLVLSYAWRATKESTILLQRLLDFELTESQLLRVGELVLDQLSTVRHRGAFSAVYPTFIKVASICQKMMPGQTKKWLDFNISLIQTKTQLITRRSGGLPFLITAIVTVERDLLRYTFDRLLEISREPVDEKAESEKMDIAQVHAFNCIKTLFIESQLATSVAPYIYEGLELALSTFSSKIWSVRNCSIMLFTALQNRLFGRKKMSARVFFSRFKGIREILIKILKSSIAEGNLETLFPVLTILSKLEANPGYDGLDEFKPLLRVCFATKYWKIREAAARAMPALITDPNQEAVSLLETCSIKNQNKMHGHLLAIKSLNVYSEELVKQLYLRFDEFFIHNKCYSTSMIYVQLLSAACKEFPNEDIIERTRIWFLENNSLYEIDGSRHLLMKEVFKFISSNDVDLLNQGLKSPFFEVQLEAIDFCAKSKAQLLALSEIANDDDCWTYVRSKAIPLVEDYSTHKIFEFVEKQDVYGEDIKRSSLELLGSIAAKSNNCQIYESWYKLAVKSADDNEPYQIRLSALKSVLRFLNERTTSDVLWLLYNFLSDDDDEIRELASTHFGGNSVSWYDGDQFSQNFGKDALSAHVVLHQALKLNPSFSPTSGNDKVLFNVEKANFYRNKSELHTQLARMVQNSIEYLADHDTKLLKSHFSEMSDKLVKFMKEKGYDGILGWSTEEEVFEDIYGVISYLKALNMDTSNILLTAKQVQLHDYLIEFLSN